MLEDIAIMRALPNMVVIVPADYEQTKQATLAVAKYQGPTYIRFAREKTEQITTPKTPFIIGKAQVLTAGKDITIIAAGPVLAEAIKAATELKKHNIHATVINCHTIKPLDKQTIIQAAKTTRHIITVEEAQVTGGLGGAVAELLSEHCPTKLVRIGVQDHFGESGEPRELLHKFGFSSKHISNKAKQMLRRQ